MKEREHLEMDKEAFAIEKADVARREECLEDYGQLFSVNINNTTANNTTATTRATTTA